MKHALQSGSYYGMTAECQEVAGLVLTESDYQSGTTIPTHCHENAFFYLVIDGACREKTDKRDRVADPATLVYHPAEEPHSNQWTGSACRCFHVELGTTWVRRLESQALMLQGPEDFYGSRPAQFAVRLYQEFKHPDAVSPLAIEGLALELLAEIARAPKPLHVTAPQRWLDQTRELLHEQFAEGLDVQTIARIVNVHPAHLVRGFRQQYHCTMGDYVRNLRVEFACRQLSATDIPLAEIALIAGFSDQSHFCKVFKRIIGTTPAQYRRHFRLCNSHTMV